ncbi:hypothetical protein ZIOFF_050342 [Zingiber officinale]|uniref:Bifunctional inhibitor/plant lipid transfer protein/seed storage helical domain-containing protein n=1 Tax=Zingiber officinale TaxID=94328 RepID=A0A8J5G0D7_ZINOF|nr:hypothetical protein ZIOFF_050342 [Zingiber officinale]
MEFEAIQTTSVVIRTILPAYHFTALLHLYHSLPRNRLSALDISATCLMNFYSQYTCLDHLHFWCYECVSLILYVVELLTAEVAVHVISQEQQHSPLRIATSLSRCSTYVEAGSNLSRPQKGCCRAVAAVAGAEPACLCGLIDDYRGFGVRVDTTRALMLPSACRAPPPPASLCAVLGMPVATAVLPPSEKPGTGCCASGAPAAAPPIKNGGCRLTTMVWRDPRHAFCLALLLLLSYSFPSL